MSGESQRHVTIVHVQPVGCSSVLQARRRGMTIPFAADRMVGQLRRYAQGTREALTDEVRVSRGRARESQDTESRDSNKVYSNCLGYNSGAQSAPYI